MVDFNKDKDNNIKDVEFEHIVTEKETNNIRGKVLYYSTSQVAHILDETDSKIRYYTNIFDDILKIEISNKQRRYTDKNIEALKFIIELKNEGMTIKQIQEYCQEVDFDNTNGVQIKESNPLSIQTLAKALMEEQHKQMVEFKQEMTQIMTQQLQQQIEVIKNNNESLRDNIIEQISVTVDEITSNKLNEAIGEMKLTLDAQEQRFKDRDTMLIDKLHRKMEERQLQQEYKQQLQQKKSIFSRLFSSK